MNGINADSAEINALSERVLGAVFEVSNTLGAGFLEKVYQRALLRELTLRGIQATTQVSLAVTYKGYPVGEYFADLMVEGVLVVELKCSERLTNDHVAQCLHYLRASGLPICLLVNFQRARLSGGASFTLLSPPTSDSPRRQMTRSRRSRSEAVLPGTAAWCPTSRAQCPPIAAR